MGAREEGGIIKSGDLENSEITILIKIKSKKIIFFINIKNVDIFQYYY